MCDLKKSLYGYEKSNVEEYLKELELEYKYDEKKNKQKRLTEIINENIHLRKVIDKLTVESQKIDQNNSSMLNFIASEFTDIEEIASDTLEKLAAKKKFVQDRLSDKLEELSYWEEKLKMMRGDLIDIHKKYQTAYDEGGDYSVL